MSIPIKAIDLLKSSAVESCRIEYKSDWNPEAIIHTICAFANDIDNIGGGYIVVGVAEENGCPIVPIKGIEEFRLDGIQKELLQYCHLIEPLYLPQAEPQKIDEKWVLLIWVSGGYGRPYKAPKNIYINKKERVSTEKCYYIRKFSNTIVASSDDEKELFYISSDIPFDDRPNLIAKVDDLDIGLIREHLKTINSGLSSYAENKELLELAEDLQLVAGPPENLHPLNVGLLMFSEHPEKYFRYARIEVVDIPDPTGKSMEEKVFSGPIQRQLKDALAYIKNYVIKEAVIKSDSVAEATRIYNYPFVAIEEVLSNAVYHKSYQINEPIVVRITKYSLEISSFPGFDRTISDEDIEAFNIRAGRYRNRRIGDFLKELRLTEGRNTGFPNVYNSLKNNGSDMPEFIMDENRGYIVVKFKINKFFNDKHEKNDAYLAKVMEELEKNELSMTELAKSLGYKGISKKLSKTVDELKNNNLVSEIFDERDRKIRLRLNRKSK